MTQLAYFLGLYVNPIAAKNVRNSRAIDVKSWEESKKNFTATTTMSNLKKLCLFICIILLIHKKVGQLLWQLYFTIFS